MDPNVTSRIERATVERYSRRLRELGDTPRALGWDTSENQATRFRAFLQAQPLEGRSVLDVGCGFGDFFAFLKAMKVGITSYTGWDVNPDLLAVAKSRHPEARFEERNVLVEAPMGPIADVVVMMGVLNFRLSEVSNTVYASNFLRGAWPAAREVMLCDMLSKHLAPDHPEEPHVFYYDPGEMMAFARTLSPHFSVKQDYPAIPQKEFILAIRREAAR